MIRTAIIVVCTLVLIATSLLYNGRSEIGQPKINHPLLSFDEISVRGHGVGKYFPVEVFFSGPNEIKIHSDGKIAINNAVTKGWIYGELNQEQISRILNKINDANFTLTEKRRGFCDEHGLFTEVDITVDGKKYSYSECAQVVPIKLFPLAKDIFQISEEFIASAFSDLANKRNSQAAFELSCKYVPQQFEFEKIEDNTRTNDTNVMQAYFWAAVARLIAKKTYGFYPISNGEGLDGSYLELRFTKLENKLNDASLEEMNRRVSDWREKYLNNISVNEGNNK